MKAKRNRFPAVSFCSWRRHPESNWGIKVLQTSALPLGYGAVFPSYGSYGGNEGHSRHMIFGADDEARTRYLHLGKVALYQMSYIRILSTFLSVIFIIAKQCRKVNRILKKFLELSKHSPEIYQLSKIPFSSILNSAKQYWLTFTRPARNRSGGQVNDALEIKTHQNPPSRPQAKQRCERISGSGAYSPRDRKSVV